MSLAVVFSRAALWNARFDSPGGRVTVNLAPADLPKESGRFDLPIAIGILAATGQVPAKQVDKLEFAGELALSGELRPIRGALAQGATVLPARTLLDVVAHLHAQPAITPCARARKSVEVTYPDLADVRGQAQARRALEIAAAGSHSILNL